MSFNIGEYNYEIEFNVVDILKRGEHCTLIKNGVHVKTLKKALLMKYQLLGGNNAWLMVFACLIVGAIFSFGSVSYIPVIFAS